MEEGRGEVRGGIHLGAPARGWYLKPWEESTEREAGWALSMRAAILVPRKVDSQATRDNFCQRGLRQAQFQKSSWFIRVEATDLEAQRKRRETGRRGRKDRRGIQEQVRYCPDGVVTVPTRPRAPGGGTSGMVCREGGVQPHCRQVTPRLHLVPGRLPPPATRYVRVPYH